MKRTVLALSITALMLPLSGALTPAEAGGGRGAWHAQTSFRVGDFNFSLGYHEPARHRDGRRHYGTGYGYRPKYYYRTPAPIRYEGYSCNSACYRESKHYYHTPSCGLVRQHFRVNHFMPPGLPYYYSPYSRDVYYYQPYYYYPRHRAPAPRRHRRGW